VSSPRLRPGVAAAIVVVVLACFLPALGSDFVLWDDDMNFTDNPSYRGLSPAHLRWMFTTFHGGHWQPLSWMTLGLDYGLWGMNPLGYHLTNVLLHAVNALLVYRLIAALVPGVGARAAAVGALLFAIHPLRVESVAWVTERRDVLSGLFFLLTVLAYVRYARARDAGQPWRAPFAVSVACFALSLLAKAWGVTLPLVLLVLDVYPLRRFSPRALVEKVPYAVLAAGGAVLAQLASNLVPAKRTLAQHDLVQRAAQAAYGLVFYLWKTVVPTRLSPIYLLELTVRPTAARYVACVLLVAAVTGAVVLVRRRAPWAAAAWACYVLVLVTVLGFVQTGPQIVADRYSYLACLPWVVLAAAAVGQRPAAIALAVAALAVLGVLTVRQTRVWHDSRSLWEHTLRIDPDNYVAYLNRGTVRQYEGDLVGAFGDYTEAVRRNPEYFHAWYSRATERLTLGDDAGAIADYTATLRIDPWYIEALNNRGLARQRTNDLEGAVADFEEALRLAPPDWAPRSMIEGNLLMVRDALARRAR
jgi:protein O-mannosyl-transferase